MYLVLHIPGVGVPEHVGVAVDPAEVGGDVRPLAVCLALDGVAGKLEIISIHLMMLHSLGVLVALQTRSNWLDSLSSWLDSWIF